MSSFSASTSPGDASEWRQIILPKQPPFRLGEVEVEPALRRMRHDDGRELVIEPRVMEVMVALWHANGALVSRQDLLDCCWAGRTVSKDAVNRVISQIRGLATGIAAGSFEIITVNKVGYRLTTAATAIPSARSAPPEPGANRRHALLLGAGMLAASAMAGGIAYFRGQPTDQRRKMPTIAVMPFDERGSVPDFAGPGMAREVRQALSRIGGIRVISDASSLQLAQDKLQPAELGRRLGADIIIFGSLTREGGGLTGRAELVEAKTQTQELSFVEAVAGPDVMALADALAGRLVEEAITRLVPLASPAQLPPRRRLDPRAYPHMLKAEQAFLLTRSLRVGGNVAVAAAQAEEAFDQAMAALAIDPNDVRSLLVLWRLARNGWSQRLYAVQPAGADRASAATHYVRRALAADPNDPAALAALADCYRRYEWRWQDAEALLKRAIAADPGLLEARWAYGTLLGVLNRAPEGVSHAEEIHLLDPTNATLRGYLRPRLTYAAGVKTVALRQYDALLNSDPAGAFITREIYMTHLTAGDASGLDRLLGTVGKQPSAKADARNIMGRIHAAAEALRGRPGGFRDLLDGEMRRTTGESPTSEGRIDNDRLFLAALEFGWAGDAVASIDLLGRALNAGSLNWIASLPYGVSPLPRAVKDDARFTALWRRDPRLMELMSIRRENLGRGLARTIA
ncbi:hypothetical protein ACFB49_38180 [Sphingomonas sp. DBB INV C78]|uniref:winged helix-turn-helix domain-containing protein n=1 Tax=Sphingomonas sp. DBB INV C78 TaxID=3349434 RepID=UPI0036D35AA1